MIVRIMGEGQWQTPGRLVQRLNVLDDLVMGAVNTRDSDLLAELLEEMADTVKKAGAKLPSEPVVLSDLIVPDPRTPLDEVADWLQESRTDDGLIPG